MARRIVAEVTISGMAVHVDQVSPLRWEAWSPGLPNPRHGLTAAAAVRRLQADLDHEWHTGSPHRYQRVPR